MRGLTSMLVGIFLAVMSVWCLIFGEGGTNIVTIAGVFLPIPAFICLMSGYCADSSDGTKNAAPQEQDPSEIVKTKDTNH